METLAQIFWMPDHLLAESYFNQDAHARQLFVPYVPEGWEVVGDVPVRWFDPRTDDPWWDPDSYPRNAVAAMVSAQIRELA